MSASTGGVHADGRVRAAFYGSSSNAFGSHTPEDERHQSARARGRASGTSSGVGGGGDDDERNSDSDYDPSISQLLRRSKAELRARHRANPPQRQTATTHAQPQRAARQHADASPDTSGSGFAPLAWTLNMTRVNQLLVGVDGNPRQFVAGESILITWGEIAGWSARTRV